MMKPEILNICQLLKDNFRPEYIDTVLTNYNVDYYDNISLFISAVMCLACSTPQAEKESNKDFKLINDLIPAELLTKLLDELKSMEDEEKLLLYQELDNDLFLPVFLFDNSDSKFCSRLIHQSHANIFIVHNSLQLHTVPDEVKIDLLNSDYYEFSPEQRRELIESLQNDNNKFDFLYDDDVINDPNTWMKTILSMTSDDIRLESLKKIKQRVNVKEHGYCCERVICSFIDVEKQIACAKEFPEVVSSVAFKVIIKKLTNHEDIRKFITDPVFNLDQYDLLDVVRWLEDDKLKVELLKDKNLKWATWSIGIIAKSIKDDTVKIEVIKDKELRLEPSTRIDIACSISDDNVKFKILSDPSFEFYLSEVVRLTQSITNDQYKLQILDNLFSRLDDNYTALIIASFSDDNIKLEQMRLRNIKDCDNIISIITSCKNPQNVIKGLIPIVDMNITNNGPTRVLETLLHMERDDAHLIYEGVVPFLSEYICYQYKLHSENFQKVSQKYGYNIIKYLTSNVVRDFINGPIEDIDKIAYLISGPDMNMDDVHNIYHCLLQRQFLQDNGNIINIFSNLNLAFDEENMDAITYNINSIVQHKCVFKILSNKKLLNDVVDKGYILDDNRESFSKFLNKLCQDIMAEKNADRKKELKDLLHIITDNYIQSSREEYVALYLNNMAYELKLTKVANKDKQFKLIFEKIESDKIKEIIKNLDKSQIKNEETLYLLSPVGNTIIDACIEFKKNPKKYNGTQISKEELTGKYLKMFNGLMNACYEQKLLKGLCEEDSIMQLDVDHVNRISLYEILTNLDYDVVVSKLLPFEEKLEKVKLAIDKCKIYDWGETFEPILTNLDLESRENLLATLISSGYRLEDKYDCNNLNINNIISFANMFSHTSIVYKTLFGSDNCMYLINDPGPNKSSMKKNEKIRHAVEYYKKLYEKASVTVPTISKTYDIGNKKVLKAVIGDVANPINLTLGERTGACMRIGGVGSSLFDFCNLNENGFHIRFEDPSTGNFISRVSCFRNGNTVFANEMRYSVDCKYTNADLVDCLNQVARDLIEISKDSEQSIDNVVVSQDYAMSGKGKGIHLGVSNIKKGYNIFYSDVSSNNAILLASSNNDQLVPVKLEPCVSKYPVLRMEAKHHLDNDKANTAVNHVKLVEKMLTNESFDNIEIVTDAKIAITGEDWYIYVDQNNTVHNKVINGISDSRRIFAEDEMSQHLQSLKQFVSNDQKGDGPNAK